MNLKGSSRFCQKRKSKAKEEEEEAEQAAAMAVDGRMTKDESLELLRSIKGFEKCASWDDAVKQRERELARHEYQKKYHQNRAASTYGVTK